MTHLNEIIQNFSQQARQQVPKGVLDPDLWIDQYNIILSNLVITECLNIINNTKEHKEVQDGWHPYDEGWNPALEEAEENIKQYFSLKQE
jgi:hypothetical protein